MATKTANGKTAATNGKASSSKADNGSSKTKAKAEEQAAPEQVTSATDVAKYIRKILHKKYGVVLDTRKKNAETALYYAAKELLEKQLSQKMKGSNKTLDWNEWNSKICPAILGKPGELKYEPEVLAEAIALLIPSISLDAQEAIKDLAQYNQQSLMARRQQQQKAKDEDETFDLDELDELDDLDFDQRMEQKNGLEDEDEDGDEDDDLEDEDED